MILLIDNFDSFTYNLYQLCLELGKEVEVRRNNAISVSEVAMMQPDAIILSPGPGRPEDSGVCAEVVNAFYEEIPILGVCLGHQLIGQLFGGIITQAKEIKHGKCSPITHQSGELFEEIAPCFDAMRYHSLVIERNSLPECFELTAFSLDDGEIMAIAHKEYPLYGVQFHPESIGTPVGKQLLTNFFQLNRKGRAIYA
ncbi:aminodeoxychorismate/anthranilate synthase component II [Pradoshia eiseniae]|uniref:Aminodeoxychorismate/anthranilate synthase component II n=1 Tax=Pradoshia eiseniae TaxID=2064768 RepID=A0A2S7N4P5_9BACI|nr:aminodeoxychorismate/anthranilate synthase component II [Pradoshia eiseniae]PQD97042.1 aminodeoxychorismate/anthranilate synthase component II [Pradoshia eiseniae]